MTSEKSEFIFEGTTKRHNALTLTSSLLAMVFQLVESTIVLVDEDGNTYMPSDDGFEPSLENGKSYIVEGERVGEKSKAIIARRGEQVVEVLREDQRDRIIENTILSCSHLHENATMLYSGPLTVCLAQSLQVLVSYGRDISLISDTTPATSFALLKNPTSFRDCIHQLVSAISDAFQQSNEAMKKIKSTLEKIPNYFLELIEWMGPKIDDENAENNEKIEKILNEIFNDIKEAAEASREMAFEAIQPINHVLEVIDELCHASNGSKGFNEKARQELLNLFEQVKFEKQAKEEQTTRLEQETQEAQKTLAQAYNEYMVQVNKPVPNVQAITKRIFFGLFKKRRYDDSQQKAHLAKTNQLKADYDRHSAHEAALRHTLEQLHLELVNSMNRIKTMETQSDDLSNVIQVLREGITLLAKIRGQWMDLVNFFDKIKLVLDEYLIKSINNFMTGAKHNAAKIMLREALKAICLCFQVSNVAEIYAMIMDNHVMPQLEGLENVFVLSENEAKAKLLELETIHVNLGQTVKELILAKQKELQDTAKIQSEQYGSALVGAQIYGIMNRNLLEERHELVKPKKHW
uniref:Uncharacterized protein n=1 Tax=Acrobeloides nanus TaxID=290746 RepID=A0A914ENN5_9BILA